MAINVQPDIGRAQVDGEAEKRLVRYRKESGQIAIITFDDPPANTYSYEMMRQLDDAILTARFDKEVQVIVLTGAGEKFFCAGANITMLQTVDPTFKYYFCLHANETLTRFEQTPKIVIAALNGHTVGGGLEIAMACDIRLARKNAGKIGLPEVALGVLPGTGGTQRLTRLVGRAKALELMITGRTFSFEEAQELGLVTDIIEGDGESFLADVLAYARQFTTPNKASKAVGNIKRSVVSGGEVPFSESLAIERELQCLLFQSKDAKEGLNAYVEKRMAKFSGE
ncbi:MAG: enoyl-CoA hydratase/isomerase family protein [Candidatus Eremiobacteraeota bacterium]|nr:enoyl-CoA hydratase/isomerase family protein [Candidatus Eremiobacteraeota bacterium]MBC5828123.1 enoyl-CoA hydratase/isomerase family protein [Candidatus Eremiobacteraeota bacterium]